MLGNCVNATLTPQRSHQIDRVILSRRWIIIISLSNANQFPEIKVFYKTLNDDVVVVVNTRFVAQISVSLYRFNKSIYL